jgi:hypothetical protein
MRRVLRRHRRGYFSTEWTLRVSSVLRLTTALRPKRTISTRPRSTTTEVCQPY